MSKSITAHGVPNFWIMSCLSFSLSDIDSFSTLANRLDSTQLHLIAGWCNFTWHSGATWDVFKTRRNIHFRKVLHAHGRWSSFWAKSIIEWDAHCRRASSYGYFVTELLSYRDSDTLARERTNESGTANQSRTRTRNYHGHVSKRFEDSVASAVRHLDSIQSRPMTKTQNAFISEDSTHRRSTEAYWIRQFEQYEGFGWQMIV